MQCLIVLSVAAKYALDRERLSRAWAKAASLDPELFVRGRYVSLRLEVEAPAAAAQSMAARLSAVEGRLVVTSDPKGTVTIMPPFRPPPASFITEWTGPSRAQSGWG